VEIVSYLRDNIHHEIGPSERQALALFFARAHELGLIGRPGPPIDHAAIPTEAAAPGRITT
jgi:hypothetical protein